MVIVDVPQEVEIIGWLETEHGDKIPLHSLCSIGRETSNNIILSTGAVSRHHGLIHKRDNEFWIVDLGGINGIHVNGTRVIQPVHLQPDDRIQMPSAVFIFRQAYMPVSAQPDKKEVSPLLPASKPKSVLVQEENQKELALAMETVPLPVQPEKKKKTPQTPALDPTPLSVQADEKKESLQIPAIEPAAVSVLSEEKKESLQIPAIELAPLAVLPEEKPKPQLPAVEPAPLAIPMDEMQGVPEIAEIESTPVSAPSDEAQEPSQIPATKPRSKNPNDRRKRRSVPTTSAPASSSTSGPQNVCLTAKRSMYVGFVSIFLPFIGVIPAMAAIVLGHKALRTIKQSNGTLLGRDQAVTGLYFGYITLPVILAYSTLFYVLYFSSPSTPAVASTPTYDPAAEIPKSLVPPALSPSAVVANSHNTPGPAPITPSTQNTPISLSPAVAPKSEDVPDTAGNEFVARAPASLRSDPSLTDTVEKSGTKAVRSPLEITKPVAAQNPPAVFSYEVQTKLKDGMLTQPMPADSSDRSYADAEAFNNSARILARQPEAKYAESVRDFLDDVKQRNPDPVRLQILTAMYENYMAGLKQTESSGN